MVKGRFEDYIDFVAGSRFVELEEAWMRAGTMKTFYNNFSLNYLLYMFVGAIYHEYQYFCGAKPNEEDLRIHLFWAQDSNTGKNTTINFLKEVSQLVGLTFNELDSYTGDAALEGTFLHEEYSNALRTKKKSDPDPDPEDFKKLGLIHISHYLHIDEADRILFSQDDLKLKLQGYMNDKKKTERDMAKVKISGDVLSSFILTTFNLKTLNYNIIKSGFARRTILYFRNVDSHIREQMRKSMYKRISKIAYNRELNNIKKIVDEAIKNLPLGFEGKNIFRESRKPKVVEFSKPALDLMRDSIENLHSLKNKILCKERPVLEAVIGVYERLISRLSTIIALTDGEDEVQEYDVFHAKTFLDSKFFYPVAKTMFRHMHLSKTEEAEHYFYESIWRAIPGNEWLTPEDILKKLIEKQLYQGKINLGNLSLKILPNMESYGYVKKKAGADLYKKVNLVSFYSMLKEDESFRTEDEYYSSEEYRRDMESYMGYLIDEQEKAKYAEYQKLLDEERRKEMQEALRLLKEGKL